MKLFSTFAVILTATAILTAADTGNRGALKKANTQSPAAETSATINGKSVIIEYSAPSARGREVEGGLIPYDHWYRFGADSATTLTTTADIMIGDLKVPAGVHTLYLYATKNEGWKLIVNKQTKQWGTVYNADQDLGRTAMNVSKTPAFVETFKLTLSEKGTGGILAMEWGNSRATVAIK